MRDTNDSVPNGPGPWRPILVVCGLYLLGGYGVYFTAHLFPTASWAMQFIEWSMPVVKGLRSAGRVADLYGLDPFPAQAVILYCAWGSILLSVWCLYQCFFVSEHRAAWFADAEKRALRQGMTRAKLIAAGLVTASGWLFFPTILFIHSSESISWQARMFFSPTLSSATFLLVSGYLCVVAVIGLLPLYFGITNRLARFRTGD